jgi:hypothetical protein
MKKLVVVAALAAMVCGSTAVPLWRSRLSSRLADEREEGSEHVPLELQSSSRGIKATSGQQPAVRALVEVG